MRHVLNHTTCRPARGSVVLRMFDTLATRLRRAFAREGASPFSFGFGFDPELLDQGGDLRAVLQQIGVEFLARDHFGIVEFVLLRRLDKERRLHRIEEGGDQLLAHVRRQAFGRQQVLDRIALLGIAELDEIRHVRRHIQPVRLARGQKAHRPRADMFREGRR